MPCEVTNTQLIVPAVKAAASADVTIIVIGDQTTASTDADFKGQYYREVRIS